MYYRRMPRGLAYLLFPMLIAPFVFLFYLVGFLVEWKLLILAGFFLFFIIRESGIIRKFAVTLKLFILDIPNFLPSYTFRRPRKSRTFADRCGIGFSELNDNNYDAIKLDSISVEPLDETDIHAFRNTPAYKKMRAANKMNPIG